MNDEHLRRDTRFGNDLRQKFHAPGCGGRTPDELAGDPIARNDLVGRELGIERDVDVRKLSQCRIMLIWFGIVSWPIWRSRIRDHVVGGDVVDVVLDDLIACVGDVGAVVAGMGLGDGCDQLERQDDRMGWISGLVFGGLLFQQAVRSLPSNTRRGCPSPTSSVTVVRENPIVWQQRAGHINRLLTRRLLRRRGRRLSRRHGQCSLTRR